MNRSRWGMAALALTVGIVPVGVDGSQPGTSRQILVAMPGGHAMTSSEIVEVHLDYVGLERGNPPSTRLFFDVTLCNRAAEPRWFLFPTLISPTSQSAGGGISGLEVYEFIGQGRVVMGHFFGNGGFNAVLLPAGSVIALRRFPIKYWGAVPMDSLPVAVMVTDRVTIDGQPAQSWFEGSASSDTQAAVAADRGHRVSARHSPGSQELPVSFGDAHSVVTDVRIG